MVFTMLGRIITGADSGFSFRPVLGGRKGLCARTHIIRARKRTHFRQGSKARLRVLEALVLSKPYF